MTRRAARLVTYAWGEEYLDKLLTFTLGSVLAPGNLPRLAAEFDCSVVIVTEARFFDYVRQHPTGRRIESICPLRLLPLDDIVGQPWQYGISLAYALFRGFAELGPAMTDTYLLFLNADFILADGSYERLIPHMLREEPVLLAPSYCTVAERVAPLLAARCNPRTHVLAIPPRELAAITLSHRHNTVRAKTINQQLVHFEYMDQAYWEVDAETLLGHQMPISLVAMRPEIALTDLSTFWDWGIVYDFCPSQRLKVLDDSDDFLMLELREEATHLNLMRVGPTTPQAAAARMLGYITQYQIDAGRQPLTLHSRDLPPATAAGQALLQRFVDEQIQYLTLKPKDHRNHPDWLYHQEHLRRYHDEKARAAQQPQPAAPEPAATLPAGAAPFASGAAILSDPVFYPLAARMPTPATWKRALVHRMAPPTRPWHPLYLGYRDAARALRRAQAGNILFIGRPESLMGRLIDGLPGQHYGASPASVREPGWDNAVAGLPQFRIGVIELSRADLVDAPAIYKAVARRIGPDGMVILSWINSADTPSDPGIEQGLAALLLLHGAGAQVKFESSEAARRALRWARRALGQNGGAGRAARGGALLIAAAWSLIAALAHGRIRRPTPPSSACLSLTVLVEPEAAVAIAAPRPVRGPRLLQGRIAS